MKSKTEHTVKTTKRASFERRSNRTLDFHDLTEYRNSIKSPVVASQEKKGAPIGQRWD